MNTTTQPARRLLPLAWIAALSSAAALAAPLVGSTASVSAFCQSQGGCAAPTKRADAFMTTPITVSTMVLTRGGSLSVGRVKQAKGEMIITASFEVKKRVAANDWAKMRSFVQAFSGQGVTNAQLATCMKAINDSLRTSPGYARAPLTYARYGQVEMSVECFARPLGDRSGYALGVKIIPAGE